MPTKRLFTAIKLHPDNNLIEAFNSLKKSLNHESINWDILDKFHLTLKFFGDTDIEKIPRIIGILNDICKTFENFPISVEKCGVFDNFFRNPRVIWIGIKQNEQLLKLYDKINSGLVELDFAKEKRLFKPHLTIGRIKSIRNKELFKESIEKYANLSFHTEIINSFILYESILKPQGAEYKIIEQFTLKKTI
jgi:RNA 2',3'-cyclic 3'-phosphodiesterase